MLTLGCGRLDAAAAVALALSRTTAEWASGAPLAAGSCTAAGVAPPALPQTQTITFKPIPDRTTADGDFNPNAHASSRLRVTYAAYGGCSMRHGIVHVTGASLCWITAFQNGNNDIYPASPVLEVVAITDAVIPRALRAEGTADGLVSLRYRSTTLAIVATDVVVDRNGKAIARVHENASVRPRRRPLLRRVARTARGGARIAPLRRHAPEPHPRRTRAELHELRAHPTRRPPGLTRRLPDAEHV